MKNLLVLSCLFWLCLPGCSRVAHERPLSRELHEAVDGTTVSSEGQVGSFENRPFVSSLRPRFAAGKSVFVLPTFGLEMQVLVHHPGDSKLLVQASSKSSTQANFAVKINEHSLGEWQLDSKEALKTLDVKAQWLVEGFNTLRFECDERVLLHKATLTPKYRSARPAETKPRGDDLLLAFEAPLEFLWLKEEGERTLRIDRIEDWNEKGTADSLVPATLLIRIESVDPPYDKTTTHRSGESVSLELPANLDEMKLSLTARPNEPPLIGQNGLTLTNPRTELYSEPEPIPTESKATAKVQSEIETGTSPNVLLLVVDTLRADHLSCYGYERKTSPNLDRFSKEAVLFEQCSAQAPWTKPSTATILTGLHPQVHGAVDFADRLSDKIVSLAEMLGEAGYDCRALTTNVFASDIYNITQGFRTTFTPRENSHQVYSEALNFLDNRNTEKPFFLYLHTIDPHTPYAPPAKYNKWSKMEKATNATMTGLTRKIFQHYAYREPPEPKILKDLIGLYDGEILSHDAAFAELIRGLKERDLYENTLIVFTSDHGEEFFEHGGFGHISTLYEELIRIPLIMKYPGQGTVGQRVAGSWQQLDIVPTILHALKLPIPEDLSGYPFDPDSAATPPPERQIYLHVEVGQDAKETGQATFDYQIHMKGLKQRGQLYVENLAHRKNSTPVRALFDMATDPLQKKNLYAERKLDVIRFRRFLQDLETLRPLAPADSLPSSVVDEHLKSLQYLR